MSFASPSRSQFAGIRATLLSQYSLPDTFDVGRYLKLCAFDKMHALMDEVGHSNCARCGCAVRCSPFYVAACHVL